MLSRLLARVCLGACLASSAPLSAGELVHAAKKNDAEQVARMMASGADINERGGQGATPLHWMAFHGNERMVKALIDAGARVDAALANGSTPLHLTAYKGHTGVARLLLAHGADASASNSDGVTPLDWARRKGHRATADLLASGIGPARPESAEPPGSPIETAPITAKSPERPITSAPIAPEPPAPSGPPTTDAHAPTGDRTSPPAVPGGYRIQLVAVSTEQRARRAIKRYRERFPEILNGEALVIDTIDVRGRSLYRVQSGPVTSARARALCDRLKGRDQSCIIKGPGSL